MTALISAVRSAFAIPPHPTHGWPDARYVAQALRIYVAWVVLGGLVAVLGTGLVAVFG